MSSHLKDKMDILLISPDHQNKKNNFPWGILSIGSYLTNVCNKTVKILDASTHSQSKFYSLLDKYILETKVVGIGFFSSDVKFVKKLVDYIKNKNSNIKVVVGGPHSILEPEQTCEYKNIDFVAYGDGEKTINSLINELNKEKADFNKVPGLIFKENKEILRTAQPEPVGFYNIDYSLLSKKIQKTFGDYIQVLTGRGCSFRCRFCFNSIMKTRFLPKSAASIVQEIERIVSEFNPEIIYFRDENFFQDKKRIYEFIKLYKEKKFTFKWRATCRANYFHEKYITPELLKELEQINCETLKFGFESGSDRMLEYIKKGMTLKHINGTVNYLQHSKIQGVFSFMIGLPTQSYDEYIATIQLVKSILKILPNADIIGPQYFRTYPGGSLYEEIVSNYNYSKPSSFEKWDYGIKERDVMPITHEEIYPWINNKKKLLAVNANYLIALYKYPISHFLNVKGFLGLPFALFARLRMKFNLFGFLYDVRLFAILYHYFKKEIRG